MLIPDLSFCIVSIRMYSPDLQRVSYQVASRSHLDEALNALVNMPQLKVTAAVRLFVCACRVLWWWRWCVCK